MKIAHVVAALPIHGAVVMTITGPHTGQERARARLMHRLLPRLQHLERIGEVIIESRSGGDRHDRRTIARLRRAREITGELRVSHHGKQAAPLTWIADFVIGALLASWYHDEPEPWAVMNAMPAIDVVEAASE